MKWVGFTILAAFYAIYIGKMILQNKKGIQTDQIAKGKKNKVFYVELTMKIATYTVVLVEIVSIFVGRQPLSQAVIVCGMIIGFAGVIIFATAVATMKDSWRAGLAENDKTVIVTNGIYSISRNPAFLGFDCVYIGILLMFFNWILFAFTVFAMCMLHLQIKQEEQYLPKVFGENYINYQHKVHRYLGRKRR